MLKQNNYPNAYKEVYVILNHMSKDDLNLIPNEFINMLKMEMNDDYNFYLENNKKLNEQKLLRETKAILANIFVEYLATSKQRQVIEENWKKDIAKNEEEKKLKYSPDQLFKNDSASNKNNIKEVQKNTELVKY